MTIRSKLLTMMVLGLLAATSGHMASAQSDQPAIEQSPSYSDEELKSFAEVILEVQRINDAYQPSLEAARTPEEENSVQQAATDELTQVLMQKGMTVDKYKEILVVALNNADIAERIRQYIRIGQ